MGDTRKKTTNSNDQTFDRAYANRALVLLALVAAFIFYADTMLTPALPKIVTEYGVSISQASLLISLYTVFGVAVIPIFGKLGDIYGKKRVMMYILVAYIIAATTTSFAPTFNLVLISRFAQGIGLGLFSLCFSLAREQFPKDMVPRAQGTISAIQVAGGGFGLLGGAVITNLFGWQGNYHIAVPFIIVLTVLIFFGVKESMNKKPGVKLDYLGAAWLGASLTAITLGLSEGATWGWKSVPVLALMIGGLAAIVPLAFYERRVAEPVLDLKLLRQRNVMVANSVIIAFALSLGIAFQTVVYALELPSPSGFGLSIVEVGLFLLPLVVIVTPVAIGVGVLIPKYGVKPFLYVGSMLAAFGFFLLSTYSGAESILIPLMVYAVAGGMLTVSIQNLLVLSLDKGNMALGVSMNSAFRYIGQTLGAPVAGAILSTFVASYTIGGHVLSLPARDAFQDCFYLATAAFIVVGLLSIFAREVIGKKAGSRVIQTSEK
ncbi:MAG: MFS transporter [Nitrososphaerales archaeon]|jgi:MFS family permease